MTKLNFPKSTSGKIGAALNAMRPVAVARGVEVTRLGLTHTGGYHYTMFEVSRGPWVLGWFGYLPQYGSLTISERTYDPQADSILDRTHGVRDSDEFDAENLADAAAALTALIDRAESHRPQPIGGRVGNDTLRLVEYADGTRRRLRFRAGRRKYADGTERMFSKVTDPDTHEVVAHGDFSGCWGESELHFRFVRAHAPMAAFGEMPAHIKGTRFLRDFKREEQDVKREAERKEQQEKEDALCRI